VLRLPDEVSFDEGTFVEPLACVLRGQRIAGVRAGKTVAVLGSGISGILHIALARALGVGRILASDVSEFRMGLARDVGAREVFHGDDDIPGRIQAANQGRLADVVIVCAGIPSVLAQALRSVDRGGVVLFFATTPPGVDLPVPVNAFWRNGVTLVPSYAGSPADCAEALELIAGGTIPLARMITHRLPLAEIQEGFRLVAEGDRSLKVIVHPDR
jgi:L-iditol 2-dehydrogenase